MRPLEALSKAIDDSGLTKERLSKNLGRSRAYIHSYYSRKNIPSVDKYREMLDGCSCDLIIRSRDTGNEITITAENEEENTSS